MLLFSFSFLIGVSQLLWLPVINLYWLILTVPLYVFSYLYKHKHLQISLLITGICMGFSYGLVSGYFAKIHQLKITPNIHIELSGTVNSLPIVSNLGKRGSKTKFSFKIDNINHELPIRKVLVSWYNTEKDIQIGQSWTLTLKLKPIHGFKNHGSFDYSKWLFRKGYDATASVKSANINLLKSTTFFYWVDQKRSEISKLIDATFTSSRVKGLIQALSIGDKSRISYEDSLLFQETGTAHLIAISGLHIGLIAFIGVLFGRLIFFLFANERFNRFKYEAIFAIGLALFYALLAGLSIPTIRALVMVVAFSIAYASKTYISRWQAWSMALLVVLISDPFSVLDVGFWFSFSAVAVLMFSFSGRRNNQSKIVAFIKAQIVILIGLMPLMAIVFQQINLLTPIANLLVLPLASLLLIPLMFASLFLYLFSESMAKFLFQLVELLAEYLFGILDYLQQFNFLTISIQNLNFMSVLILILFMGILLLPKLFRWKILAMILLIPIFLDKPNELENNEYKVNVLDVGQGLSIIIQTRDHVMIYDTGAKFESGFSLANSVILPYLQNQGINRIDTMVLSHDDNDHAGGLMELINAYQNMQVLDVMGIYSSCQYPKSWIWNGVLFEVLSPFELKPYLANNTSCVIKLSSSNGSTLLTGDIEEPVEYRLVHSLSKKIASDVLLVPHHGSRTSSSQEFINMVNPNIALNSSGFANQFNHPHPLIKQRYLNSNMAFYDTQDKGMIELLFSKNTIKVHQYLDIYPHFWDVK